MKTKLLTLFAIAALGLPVIAQLPTPPAPAKEHEWLKKFAGEWAVETQIFMEPGKPPVATTGSETARMIGGFWVVGETKSEMMGQPFTGIMTFGYDTEKKKYVGTWIDSFNSTQWSYTGTVDETGKILVLECEGKCPMDGKHYKFRETIEWKSDNQRLMKSERMGEDGKWQIGMSSTATRK